MDHFVSNQPYFVLGNEDLENPNPCDPHDHNDDLAPSTTLLALGTIVVFQSAIILLLRLAS